LKKRDLLSSPALWLFLLTLAVRLFVLFRLCGSPYFLPESGDMKFYNDWALRIAHGQLTDHHAFYGLPGYPFLLAAFYSAIGFDTFTVPFVMGVLQAAAEGLTALLIWKIAKEVFADASVGNENANLRIKPASFIGVVAALGWTFFQPAQTFSVILMPTSWMIATFWFCVWRVLVTNHTSVWQPWLALGLLIGVMAMIVATILFLIPMVICAIFLLFKTEPCARMPRFAAATGVFIAAVFAGASPCWIHNYFIAHEPVMLSAHSGLNFYIGNNPIANGYPKIPPGMRAGQEGMLKDSITMAEAGAGRPLKRVEVSKYWSAKASDYIGQHPGSWLRLMLTKLLNFWNAYQYDDLSLITLFANAWILTPGLRFGFVAALALPGMVLILRKYRRAGWIIAAILLQMAALMPVFVTERYRLAAVPGLLLMMAYTLWELWNAIAQPRWIVAGQCAAFTTISAVFVSWPQSDPGLWSLDYYNTGIKALDAKNIPSAQRNLELAYRYVPENSEINFALGNLWLEKGDSTRAKSFYRRAIEINPRHSGAYNNLGVLAINESRWEIAAAFLRHSLEIEPSDGKTHYLLAKVYLQLGNVAGAEAEIETALRLRPQQKEFQQLRDEIASPAAKTR
jgi:tetratricopeptide (TPR) repeat protein